MDVHTGTRRKPWVAAVLSLFCTGLGHIYCGRIVVGLVLFLASLMFAPAVVVVSLLEPSTPLLIGLLAAGLLVLGAYGYAVVDAYRLARRLKDDYQPRDYNRSLVYTLFILVGVTYPALVLQDLRANWLEAFRIPSASETPNLLPGDRFLANKAAVRGKSPRRGDVVVFHAPENREQLYVKRVIALPGDTVAIKGDQIYVNGKALERDRVPATSLTSLGPDGAGGGAVFAESNAGRRYLTMVEPSPGPAADYAERTVPADTCFVLGDYRSRSADSRKFGPVPLGDITGVVQYIYFPAQSWSRFGVFRD
jgi:signal peptidase I